MADIAMPDARFDAKERRSVPILPLRQPDRTALYDASGKVSPAPAGSHHDLHQAGEANMAWA
jgi:hypothetical protein